MILISAMYTQFPGISGLAGKEFFNHGHEGIKIMIATVMSQFC